MYAPKKPSSIFRIKRLISSRRIHKSSYILRQSPAPLAEPFKHGFCSGDVKYIITFAKRINDFLKKNACPRHGCKERVCIVVILTK